MSLLASPSVVQSRSKGGTLLLLLTAGITLLAFVMHGDKGINLWDEGFFWYGAQRVLMGEVPFRDFMAYDPGRYYWSAALMKLAGNDGLLLLRATGALFQAIGVYLGLQLLNAEARRPQPVILLLAAVTLTAWMYPWFKVFDVVSSIAIVAALALLIRQPSLRQFFVLGTVVGLAAVFGRNHGVYGVMGSLGAMAFLAIRRDKQLAFQKALVSWGTGITVGFLPVILMAALIPGFAPAFWRSIIFLVFELRATNLPRPTPWPWLVQTGPLPPLETAAAISQGCFYVGIIAFGVLGLVWVFFQRLQGKSVSPALVASSLLAIPYAHYTFSRPDLTHLAQGIFPLLLGGFAVLANQRDWIRGSAAALLCGASVLTMLPEDPAWRCYATEKCHTTEVSGSKFKLDAGAVIDTGLVHKLGRVAGDDGNVLVMPFWPGAYALLHKKSPTWENYALFSRSPEFENEEIARIRAAAPRLVLINDMPLDDREEWRFHKTHPLIYQYVMTHYELMPDFIDHQWYRIYQLKSSATESR